MSITTTAIENHLSRLLILPPTESYPDGLRLVPGENLVPNRYLSELEAKEIILHKHTEVADADGNIQTRKLYAGVRYPGREALEALEQPVPTYQGIDLNKPESGLRTYNGYYHGQSGQKYTGPQITIHRRPETPEIEPLLPPKLPENLGAALAVVAQTDDGRFLGRWLTDAKGQLKAAIVARQAALKSENGKVE